MVKGIDMFREYFEEFTEQYVLIGGSACDISFHDNNMDFRATKDLDMVLVVAQCFDKRICSKILEVYSTGEIQKSCKGQW